ncbi:T9SS type A sorting domain-containing protein [Adhaeribacter soli]|uniref:T9SS type A sorting domain-containing protein n=1 Tax=Adhaeribacter soli TaxID=2607655 RepID=A0A5N1J449_9BACT|nr:T9SS type A sorting domain-containing protein [Adhaeribacter soli]KAA9340865.1 T9SS type A sorting domain-containing protein [Adhaeribacter soli]
MKKLLFPTNDQIHYPLPLNNLPKGVYVVQLETENGRQTQRLVIR